MSDKQNQSKEEAPKQERKDPYFFANVGEGPAFTAWATSYEEAVEANTKHLKNTKKENK